MSDFRERQDESRHDAMAAEPEGEPVGVVPQPVRADPARQGTWEQQRRWRIANNECPRSCGSQLEDGACSRCGWSLLEEQMTERARAKEPASDYLVRFPGALRIDEYAPASTDEEAA